jgi:hypothetical protein
MLQQEQKIPPTRGTIPVIALLGLAISQITRHELTYRN